MRIAFLHAALCAAVMAAAGAVATPDAGATPFRESVPPPEWAPCPTGAGVDPRQECATVPVPLDYAAPRGPHLSLAVSRIRTARPGLRRGVLLLIPGGPGQPGLNRPSTVVPKLPPEVLARYDIVGFDPRGVGASAPISCRLPADDVVPLHQFPWPAPDGDISANVAAARRAAASCAANGGPVLQHVSTRNEARDIDTIRRALGERRLSYWGGSYGTYAGAVYATLYPGHTDRVVLDSNDDPDPTRVARSWQANFAVGVEDRFPDFAVWAAARDAGYHLGTTPAAVRDTFLRLAGRLDRAPVPWPGTQPPVLDGNGLRATLFHSLYSDASFPFLAGVMSAALAGTPPPPIPTPPDAASQNAAAVLWATACGDVRWPRPVERYARDVAASRRAYPLTAGMPVDISPCAFWPAPSEPPVRVGSAGPSNILLVQNLRDPATPYRGALRLRAALGDRARLVAVDSGGHDAYLANGNACGDRVVTAFLATGHRPARDTLCR